MSGATIRPLLGAVLVGGQSTRLGRPKWSEPVGGVPMALRAAAALAPHARSVVAVAPAGTDFAPGLHLPVLTDAAGGPGALAGVVAALESADAAGDAGCLVLACDLPLVGPDLVAALIDRWQGEDLVAPEREGRLQPLCALWSRSALPAARHALEAGRRSVVALAERLVLRAVAETEWRPLVRAGDPLLNVNTEADLARAAELARPGGASGGRQG